MTTKEILQGIKNWIVGQDYAKQDGYYETMGVGTATNLKGQTITDNEFIYRKSGGSKGVATGTARIEAIKGQTIAWNQILKNGDFSDGTNNWSALGASVNSISVSNKECTVSKVSGSSGAIYSNNSVISNTSHKYYICATLKTNSEGVDAVVGFHTSSGSIGNNTILVTQSDTFVRLANVVTPKNDTDVFVMRSGQASTSNNSGTFKNIMCIDLTLIYGAGNEPSTPKQFEADYQRWFGKPLTYEPYDAGSLRSVLMNGLKTIGFNQWDEEWELGRYTSGVKTSTTMHIRCVSKIPVLPNTQYYIKSVSSLFIQAYDSNGNYLGEISGSSGTKNAIITTASNVYYITFWAYNTTTYNNDICINLSLSGVKNGTYEPYEEHNVSVPVTTMAGKLNGEGSSVVIFPDGMKGVGDVKDELYYVGGKTYAIKRVGDLDFGAESTTWTYQLEYNGFITNDLLNNIADAYSLPNAICSKYTKIYGSHIVSGIAPDKTFGYSSTAGKLFVKDTSYTEASTFKTANENTHLYYELATPLVYEVDDFTLPNYYLVNSGGTEEVTMPQGVANYVAPIISIRYAMDAVKTLSKLPIDYISEESMDDFLAPLGLAMGGTWTKTFNEETGKYNFVFTPYGDSSE